VFFVSVKIGLFYVIYYAFLAGFFMGMLLIFYQTLDDKVSQSMKTRDGKKENRRKEKNIDKKIIQSMK
jgi:hypothetical protein